MTQPSPHTPSGTYRRGRQHKQSSKFSNNEVFEERRRKHKYMRAPPRDPTHGGTRQCHRRSGNRPCAVYDLLKTKPALARTPPPRGRTPSKTSGDSKELPRYRWSQPSMTYAYLRKSVLDTGLSSPPALGR
ncbi:unnamed protein product, partial [Ectocarpus sp. 6 AP-2014]